MTGMRGTVSASLVMGLAQSCFNRRKMPEMRVPAMLMLMKKTKLMMYTPQGTGVVRPVTVRPWSSWSYQE